MSWSRCQLVQPEDSLGHISVAGEGEVDRLCVFLGSHHHFPHVTKPLSHQDKDLFSWSNENNWILSIAWQNILEVKMSYWHTESRRQIHILLDSPDFNIFKDKNRKFNSKFYHKRVFSFTLLSLAWCGHLNLFCYKTKRENRIMRIL